MTFDYSGYCTCDSYSYPYRFEERRAKKEHRCLECNGPIHPGEVYEYATGKCEGDWFDAKTCPACLDLRKFVQAHIPCICIEHGNANEFLIEAASDAARKLDGRWTYRRVLRVVAE